MDRILNTQWHADSTGTRRKRDSCIFAFVDERLDVASSFLGLFSFFSVSLCLDQRQWNTNSEGCTTRRWGKMKSTVKRETTRALLSRWSFVLSRCRNGMRRRSPKSTFSSCRFFLFVAPLLPSSCLLFFPFSLFSLSLFLSSSSMNHVPDIRSSLSIRTVITVVVRWFQTIKYRIFSKLSSQFINKWFLKRKIELISREIQVSGNLKQFEIVGNTHFWQFFAKFFHYLQSSIFSHPLQSSGN